jgi:hypothetical protein
MKTYVCLSGCDDSTRFSLETTPEERAFLEKLAKISVEHSSYNCMPTMKISDTGPDDDETGGW